MLCELCKRGVLLWGHDAEAPQHSWAGKTEADCSCRPEPLCSSCDAARVARDGFVLVERPLASRAVANDRRFLQ